MKKSLLALLLGVTTILAACGTDTSSTNTNSAEKTLIMGTSADYPPFEYIDTAKGDEIIGFDVDLAKALAEKAGYTVQVKDMDFSGLIESLKAENVDFVLAGMTPTEERKQSVDFSDIYYVAKDMVIHNKDVSISSIDDLKDMTVGVQLGAIQEDTAKEWAKEVGFQVESRNRIPEIVQEVANGRFDAAIIENTVATGFIEKNDQLAGFTVEENTEEGSAIAFPKNSELKEEFNAALQEMKENGELEALIQQWFGDTEQ